MGSSRTSAAPAAAAGAITLGGELTVNRMGFGAMRLTGKGIWGPPADRAEAVRVLRRAIELGVNVHRYRRFVRSARVGRDHR